MNDLRVLVFYYFVEAALLGYVGLALIGYRLTRKQFCQVGVAQGLIVYTVRSISDLLGFNPGSHTVLVMVCLIVVLRLVTHQRWALCSVASMLAFIILYVSEGLLMPPLLNYLDLTYEEATANPWLHIAMGYCGNWLVILVSIYLTFSKKVLFNVNRIQNIQ